MWSKTWVKVTLWCTLGVLLLMGLLFGAYWLLTDSTMPQDGEISLVFQPDGSAQMTWTKGPGAEDYRVTVLQGETAVYTQNAATNQCIVPALPEETLTFRIEATKTFLGKTYPGRKKLTVTTDLAVPKVLETACSVDPETDMLTVTAKTDGTTENTLKLVLAGEEKTLPMTEGTISLDFGKEYSIPIKGQECKFSVIPCRKNGQITCVGPESDPVAVARKEFFGADLTATCDLSDTAELTFRWDEVRADSYALEQSTEGGPWTRVESLEGFSVTVPAPDIFSDHAFRVVAINDGEENIYSAETLISAKYRAENATVWPLKSLTVYETPDQTGSLGTAPAGQAYWVLEQKGDMLKVRFGSSQGWIDGRYCMINLPEYLGDLVSYQITNSYSSIFKVHGEAIADVTDTVLTGYESVRQADDTFLVPLMYPTAKKLALAALEARSYGYRLKIYEAYRPQQATISIYDLTSLVLGQTAGETGLTYQQLMTDSGRYALGNFLAQGTSNHNRGIALDLTLEDLQGNEVAMQTDIHDLSWYSEVEANNDMAELLRQIMTENGFAPLKSEWWHFQDNELKEELSLKPMMAGISAQCWIFTENVWHYRLADGTYETN